MKNETQELKLIEIKKSTDDLVSVVENLIIKTDKDMVGATGMLNNIVMRKKRVEELRLFFTKPLNDQVKKINDEFREVRSPLELLEQAVKSKILRFRELELKKIEKERKIKEERELKKFEREQAKLKARAEKEAEKERQRLAKLELSKKDEKKELKRISDEQAEKERQADQDEFVFNDSDFQQSKTVHSNNGSIQIKKEWTSEIINENDVPRHYLIVDEKAIRKAVRGGVRMINGVRIFEREIIGTRGL